MDDELLTNGMVCITGGAVIAANASMHGGFTTEAYVLTMILALGGSVLGLGDIVVNEVNDA